VLVLDAEDEHLDARNQTVGSKCGAKGCNFEEAVSSADGAEVPKPKPAILDYDGDIEAVCRELGEHQDGHRAFMDRFRGRTQVGHSGHGVATIDGAARHLHAYVSGAPLPIPDAPALKSHPSLSQEFFIRLCADDLKTFFAEARLGLDQVDGSDSGAFNEWFWFSTRTGPLIHAARDRVLETTDRTQDPYCVVARGMVPRGYGEDRYMTPGEPEAEVVVYHGDGCSACHAEMEYLTEHRVAFTARNVSRDANARQALVKLGSRTVPTTVIAGQVIVGFDTDRLKLLLKL
jgi:glutaredoxin